ARRVTDSPFEVGHGAKRPVDPSVGISVSTGPDVEYVPVELVLGRVVQTRGGPVGRLAHEVVGSVTQERKQLRRLGLVATVELVLVDVDDVHRRVEAEGDRRGVRLPRARAGRLRACLL